MAMASVVVLLGLLAMAVQPSIQQDILNPVVGSSKKINAVSAFGLIVTSSTAEKALNDSGIFTVDSYVDMKGRRYLMGTISGANVVYVNSANRPMVNVGLTLQQMVELFNIRGIIHFGSAGGIRNSLTVGTVVAPALIGHTGVWTWNKHGESNGQLVFGKFNSPENGDNLLGSVEFGGSEVYRQGSLEKNQFWLAPNARWLWLASKIEGVVTGLKAASSDIYVKNYAYREFLWYTFKASTVDTTSSAVALGAISNDLPFIVFRGVANTAGASDQSNGTLANENAVKAVNRFIFLATVPREVYED
ncbi:hypothetical protein JCGZ_08882 [Jatropha curcas]|uniref:Vegetative storage protein 2 n=1 Tax=Jatropha curcas TaxID=180498 RepID=A0A067KXQ9_JATCU|nr:vegetative storage protein 2 [Jatropha curcas]KDP36629.1 hypothetical protein JCGZ_08882 [Jatropha curcas]